MRKEKEQGEGHMRVGNDVNAKFHIIACKCMPRLAADLSPSFLEHLVFLKSWLFTEFLCFGEKLHFPEPSPEGILS